MINTSSYCWCIYTTEYKGNCNSSPFLKINVLFRGAGLFSSPVDPLGYLFCIFLFKLAKNKIKIKLNTASVYFFPLSLMPHFLYYTSLYNL